MSDHIGIRLSGVEEDYTWKLNSFPKEYSLNSQYWPDTKTVFSYPASEEWENIYTNITVGDYITVNNNKYLITSKALKDIDNTKKELGHIVITTADREIDIIRYDQSGGGGAHRLLGLMLLITVGWEEYE